MAQFTLLKCIMDDSVKREMESQKSEKYSYLDAQQLQQSTVVVCLDIV